MGVGGGRGGRGMVFARCGGGAGLIREWPLVGEAEGPTGYLVGGTQQAPPHPLSFYPLPS